MRTLARIALVAGALGYALITGAGAWAVECSFVAPYDLPGDVDRKDRIANRAPDASARGRSGSVGPTHPPPHASPSHPPERRSGEPRDEPSGGPGAQYKPRDADVSPALNVEAFVQALDQRLRADTAGYVLQLRQAGNTLRTKSWRHARRAADGEVAWDADQLMHVASISKLMTAIGVVRLLDDLGLALDTRIAGYLPRDWQQGPGIERITFADLLRHKSGFATGTYFADYRFMRRQVATGVQRGGDYNYQNINFSLLRVLIPVLTGDLRPDQALDDDAWDDESLAAYARFMQRTVFAPAGVTRATLQRPASAALAYDYRGKGGGWDSGRLACTAGAAGWYMSASDVLDVLGAFRRQGTILSPARAQALLDMKLGLDSIGTVGNASYYSKNGAWWDSSRRHMEQSVAFLLPEDMELAVFVNSPIGAGGDNLTRVVAELYHQHAGVR